MNPLAAVGTFVFAWVFLFFNSDTPGYGDLVTITFGALGAAVAVGAMT